MMNHALVMGETCFSSTCNFSSFHIEGKWFNTRE